MLHKMYLLHMKAVGLCQIKLDQLFSFLYKTAKHII